MTEFIPATTKIIHRIQMALLTVSQAAMCSTLSTHTHILHRCCMHQRVICARRRN